MNARAAEILAHAGFEAAAVLDAVDRRIVLATQAGLPRVSRPYHAIAEQLGVSADEVMARLRRIFRP